MKHAKQILIATLLSTSLFTTSAAAALSPALSILAEKSPLIKTGTASAGVQFSREDFLNASALSDIESITITSLPAASSGVLYLGTVPVAVNQTVSAENLDKLIFKPSTGAAEGSFYFTSGGGYSLECSLRIDDAVNFAPVTTQYADTVAAWTQKDISCYGSLSASDPEGDALEFEIVEYPSKGLLTLLDASHGDFRYTPYIGCSGEDTFSYRVRDSYGNYSEIAPASLMISRQDSKTVFADMDQHWAHSAAIEMTERRIMSSAVESGMNVFHPDETVTREDFLVMVMKALGFEDNSPAMATVFSDDDEISSENKNYISAAYNAGIIKGREIDGKICFCPKDAITRAESAVMMNNIIGADVPVTVSAFTDNASVPAWAQGALYALNDLGILRGTGAGAISPFSAITRAQAAQILLNFTQYIE